MSLPFFSCAPGFRSPRGMGREFSGNIAAAPGLDGGPLRFRHRDQILAAPRGVRYGDTWRT